MLNGWMKGITYTQVETLCHLEQIVAEKKGRHDITVERWQVESCYLVDEVDVEEVVRPEGDRVRKALPFIAGTVSLRGVVVPLDRVPVTDLRGMRLGVPSSAHILIHKLHMKLK